MKTEAGTGTCVYKSWDARARQQPPQLGDKPRMGSVSEPSAGKTLLTPYAPTLGLQNCERICFCV